METNLIEMAGEPSEEAPSIRKQASNKWTAPRECRSTFREWRGRAYATTERQPETRSYRAIEAGHRHGSHRQEEGKWADRRTGKRQYNYDNGERTNKWIATKELKGEKWNSGRLSTCLYIYITACVYRDRLLPQAHREGAKETG